MIIMARTILRCEKCYSYGLSKTCSCGGQRVLPHPPKYSPEDKYAKYRRMAKDELSLTHA